MVFIAEILRNTCSEQDSKPKKLPLPRLNACPICGGKGKVWQNKQGKECFASVHCKNEECGYGTITRRPKDGESNRENKIAAIEEWNEGLIYSPEELKRLNRKASKMNKKEKEAKKKAKKRQLNVRKNT